MAGRLANNYCRPRKGGSRLTLAFDRYPTTGLHECCHLSLSLPTARPITVELEETGWMPEAVVPVRGSSDHAMQFRRMPDV